MKDFLVHSYNTGKYFIVNTKSAEEALRICIDKKLIKRRHINIVDAMNADTQSEEGLYSAEPIPFGLSREQWLRYNPDIPVIE